MRECRFRAWDKVEQCWLDPEHFYITGSGDPFTCQQGWYNISCRYELMGTGRYIIVRSTGLLDKNGKEIYEGDIIKVLFSGEKLIYVCEWYNEVGAWVFRGNGEWLMYEDVFEAAEIIGDIHSAPELLETK